MTRKPIMTASHKSSSDAVPHKLKAVQNLAMNALSRVEEVFHDNPAEIVSKQSGMLPREIEDSQTYFLQKIDHARTVLEELGDLLQLASEKPDERELVSMELMLLFVLIENYRPQRISDLGWDLSAEVQITIRERFESLGLDIINMRERLK